MDSEEWTTIKGYDYFISTHGNVENALTGKLLKPILDDVGYYRVIFYRNRKAINHRIHRLVAEAFIDNPDNKRCVDHIDNNKLNNHVDNLRWATDSENSKNASIALNNTSGIKGVHYDKSRKKWCAQICIGGKHKNIGRFNTIEEAQKARQEYANDFFGEFANSCEKL